MKIGIIGSGAVGQELAKGFTAEGHEVQVATREPASDKANQLRADLNGVTVTDFATAAQQAELIVLAVHHSGIQDAIALIGAENLAGKVVIDTTNAITPEADTLVYDAGVTSLGEQIQAGLPDSHVVKAFNTVGAALMYKPDFGEQTPTMFIAGNDTGSKQQVRDIVTAFGWEPLDTGAIIAARSLEAMVIIWVNQSMTAGEHHAFKML